MSNLSGKQYALTAFTRMPPWKTIGLRLVFGLIRISLMRPEVGGFVSGLMIGTVAVVILGMLRLFGVDTDVVMRLGSLVLAPGTVAWLVGLVMGLAIAGMIGAIVGHFYRPKWSILGRVSIIQENLINLSFIHFARWVIIGKNQFPRLAEAQPRETLHYDYLLFESNFNGDWEKYIDAFSQVIPGGMDNIWRWSVRYPGSRPITPFLQYIRNCQYDTDYYYSAYPGASTNDIRGALELSTQLNDFVTTSAGLAPAEFLRAYNRFLGRVQNCLSQTGPQVPPLVRPASAPAVIPPAIAPRPSIGSMSHV